jgi:cytochrome c556
MWTSARLLVLALLPFGGATYASIRPPAPAARLPAPENLSAAVRAALRERMSQHGNTMSSLVRALVLLDRPTITNLAERIADEEVVARANADGPEKWKPVLPKEFFAQQDALRTNARDLAASAAHGDTDSVMADRFAALAKTCVACHSVYLHGRPEPPGRPELGR